MRETTRPAAPGRAISEELATWAVLPSVIYPRNFDEFLASGRRLGTLAGVPLERLQEMVDVCRTEDRTALLNVDTCPGLGRDDAALAYVKQVGFRGVLSTRLGILQKAKALGLFTVQVLFLTDGSTVGKGIAATRSAAPHLVQVMPAPVVSRLHPTEREQLGPFVASGFVRSVADVTDVVGTGALAATATRPELWALRREDLGAATIPTQRST